jgi:DNA-binding NtrC family response regulator
MRDPICIPVDGARAKTLVEETDLLRADEGASAKPCIAVIESRTFLQELIRRSMQSAFALPVMTYSTVSELEGQLKKASPRLVILSLMQGNPARASTLKVLLELVPTVPAIVLASFDDVDLARTVLRLGAKGYISVAKGFEIAIEAVRFVLDGAEALSSDRPLQCGGPRPLEGGGGRRAGAQRSGGGRRLRRGA